MFTINVISCDILISSDVFGNTTCEFTWPNICGYKDTSPYQPGWILREVNIYNDTDSSAAQGDHT